MTKNAEITVTTTSVVPGKKITSVKGVVFCQREHKIGHRDANLVKDWNNSLDEIRHHASMLDAAAVVDLNASFNPCCPDNITILICLTGTAVTLAPE